MGQARIEPRPLHWSWCCGGRPCCHSLFLDPCKVEGFLDEAIKAVLVSAEEFGATVPAFGGWYFLL